MEEGEATPLGLILCADKGDEQVELLQLDRSGIRVATYLTELPPTNLAEYNANNALFAAVNASGDRSRLMYAAECATDAASDRAFEAARQCVLLRDILGNPFHPVVFDPDWRTPTVTALARQMYESLSLLLRTFDKAMGLAPTDWRSARTTKSGRCGTRPRWWRG